MVKWEIVRIQGKFWVMLGFFKEDEQLIMSVAIKGEFAEQFKRRLIPIAEAPYSLYGRKLKEAEN